MSALRTLALAAVAAAALAGSAQAQTTATPGTPPVAGHRGHDRDRDDRGGVLRKLNLTDAQKSQVKAIRAKYQPQLKASREQSKPLIEAARAARQKGDTAAFRSNMEKARQASSAIRTQEMNEIRAVLTPDQIAKLDAAKADRKQDRGQRRGKRGQWKHGRRGKKGGV